MRRRNCTAEFRKIFRMETDFKYRMRNGTLKLLSALLNEKEGDKTYGKSECMGKIW